MTHIPVEILLVDERNLPCRGMRDIIDKYPSISLAAEVRNHRDAIHACLADAPDVVIVDAATANIDGVEVVGGIRNFFENPPPVLCLVNEHDETAREIVKAGASGLLYMYSSPEEFEAAVLMLGAGYSISLNSPYTEQRYSWDAPKEEDGGSDELSSREFEVLGLIARGRTNAEIAGMLELRESTVKSHVQRLLRKTEKKSRAELTVLAYEKYMTPRALDETA